MVSYFGSCLKRLFRSPVLWAAAAGTVALSLFSPLYYNSQDESSLSILEVYLGYQEKALLTSTQFCSYAVFRKGFGAWLRMFVPVIISLAAVNLKADEQNSGSWRNFLFRAGKPAYHVGSCLFYLISGGLVLVLGYGIFGLAVLGMFPGLGRFPVEESALYLESLQGQGSALGGLFGIGGFPLVIAVFFLEIFLYGMEQSAAAMFLSLFTGNKYILVCTPFFLHYMLGQTVTLFPHLARSLNLNLPLDPYEIANIWSPEAVLTLFEYRNSFLWVLLLHMGYLAAVFLLYCLISMKRGREA